MQILLGHTVLYVKEVFKYFHSKLLYKYVTTSWTYSMITYLFTIGTCAVQCTSLMLQTSFIPGTEQVWNLLRIMLTINKPTFSLLVHSLSSVQNIQEVLSIFNIGGRYTKRVKEIFSVFASLYNTGEVLISPVRAGGWFHVTQTSNSFCLFRWSHA